MRKLARIFLPLLTLVLLMSCGNSLLMDQNVAVSTDASAPVSLSISADTTLGGTLGLGVHYTPTASHFAIWSPDSSNVVLNLNGTDYALSYDSSYPYSDIYSISIPGDFNLAEYHYKINGVQVRDPYGVMAKASENVNIVMDLSQTDPDGGWVARPALNEREDAVIYETHIRDFTYDSTSGVSVDKRGKFLGMVETGTSYNGYATGIDHLKELGVNTIQILPFFDFNTGMYNWGYDPRNYNVPEDQYASNPDDYIARIKELKTMINEFHRNGFRVVMDVVYNHTFDKSMFEGISGRYYTAADLSGCGNSIDTGEAMVSKMILDSLNYWVSEYNIDGFRFDLMGVFEYPAVRDWGLELNAAYPDRNLLLYGEPWMGSGWDTDQTMRVRLGKMPALADAHIGAFNDQFRSALKGSSDGIDGNYIFNNGSGINMSMGSRGGILYSLSTAILPNDWDPMFAYDPEQDISYVSAHDNLTLWDKIAHVGITGGYARRIDELATGIILTSQGISFLHGGEEMLRSKVYNGDWTYAHNSYNAPDPYNVYHWNLLADNQDVFQYYKDLIALRNDHPGFRMNTWNEINDNVTTTVVSDQVLVTQIDSDKNGDSWDDIIVIYNSADAYTYSLPAGDWEVVVEGVNGSASRMVSGSVAAEGTAVTVLRKTGGSTGWTEAYFRGTPNSWGTTAMAKNSATGLWETTQYFSGADARFKVDHYGDWSEAYPSAANPSGGYSGDYYVTDGEGYYDISFDDSSKAVTAVKQSGTTHSVSGTVTASGAGLSGVTVTLGSFSAVTDASGSYSISGVSDGSYTAAASLSGYGFTPSSQAVSVSGADVNNVDFAGSSSGSDLVIHYAEFESAGSYILHPWDGLSGDVTMSYEGYINNRHWWQVTVPNAPSSFLFCFTNSNGNWDGGNRSYTSQGNDIYVLPWDNSVYTSRP